MKKTGFYIIKDKFFDDMSDPYLKGNKAGNRPHYYCFEDSSTGIYWMIPLSSRIDKYRRIMEKKEKAGKPCDILHIVKLDDNRESAFLIQDMFPITEEYIEREYTIAGNHLMLTSEHTVREIGQKARKVMGMLKRGIKFTQKAVIECLWVSPRWLTAGPLRMDCVLRFVSVGAKPASTACRLKGLVTEPTEILRRYSFAYASFEILWKNPEDFLGTPGGACF